ncbi:PilZ domain-containing protein [Terrihabitans rhizophilus]|uniref:PilZ domain-containing protein n=1 Tax=Terrihabitans rhizophilus TaxID=3092662 RepID=A0ABU4RNZ3_9HYPH|nr:PilZ domain-containing protein [Terrihabitans sp. PJ23]MDX6806534.1 PilZ domain-containing protein [Terrihabitans sp. PJ23]
MTSSDNEDGNKRNAPRMRTFKGAQLVAPGLFSTFDCIVRNMSETGALVEVPSTVGIPGVIILRLNDRTLERNCRVAWRTEQRMGLRFVSE